MKTSGREQGAPVTRFSDGSEKKVRLLIAGGIWRLRAGETPGLQGGGYSRTESMWGASPLARWAGRRRGVTAAPSEGTCVRPCGRPTGAPCLQTPGRTGRGDPGEGRRLGVRGWQQRSCRQPGAVLGYRQLAVTSGLQSVILKVHQNDNM